MLVLYQALYRKWRPRTFDDVVGQQHITETLKNQVSTGRLSHAYLFIGTRGTGKTTCAKILAKAVNCEHPENGNPCNKCRSCLGIDDGSVMDVVEMDAASNNGVDNVRALRDEAVFSPAMVKKRVYIVDEVHMLSSSAFNALLKILEEPPEHLMFILATTELHKVPATILSRCQRHSFKRLDMESIIKRLKFVSDQEKLGLSNAAAELIARLSEGGMRDALSLLDQCSGRQNIDVDDVYSAMGLAGRQSTALMLRHIAGHDTAQALELFQKLWQDGKDPATLLGELSSLQRDILMKKVAPKGGGELLSAGYDDATISDFTRAFSAGGLINNINMIQDTLGNMRSGQARILCELCIISLCEPDLGEDLPALRERVARIESALKSGAALSSPAPEAHPQKACSGFEAAPSSATVPSSEKSSTPAEEAPFDLEPSPAKTEPPPMPQASEPPVCEALSSDVEVLCADHMPLAASNADSWRSILAVLKPTMPVGIFAMLSDPVQATAQLSGDTLTLYVERGFPMNNINRPDVTARIANAGANVLGHPVQVKVLELGTQNAPSAAPEPPKGKLDELSKFSIVSFK